MCSLVVTRVDIVATLNSWRRKKERIFFFAFGRLERNFHFAVLRNSRTLRVGLQLCVVFFSSLRTFISDVICSASFNGEELEILQIHNCAQDTTMWFSRFNGKRDFSLNKLAYTRWQLQSRGVMRSHTM